MTRIVTHNAKFHADDVFAIATLLLIYPDAEVVRSRDKRDIESADIVVDVGFEYDPARGRFDHHQPGGAGEHVHGVQYASFGLIWKEYGSLIAGGDEEAILVEEKLVVPIDAADNGITLTASLIPGLDEYRLDDLCGSFVDLTKEPAEVDAAFFELVSVAKRVIENESRIAKLRVSSRALVEKAYEGANDKRVIMLENSMPWADVLLNKPEPLFVIFKVHEGKWYVRGIPDAKGSFKTRKPFPEEWAGKGDTELEELTGVPGALFCHRSRFLAGASTKEGALELAQKALNA